MKVLVTGGAGYVGSHTAKELRKKGCGVAIYDNLSRGHRWAVKNGEFIEGDLADEGKLHEVFSSHAIGAVLHFAALALVGESVSDPQKYYDNNVGGTVTLLRVMLSHGVRFFILSSTCAVYGDPKEIPMTEEHPLDPVNPYGMSKLIVERILADYDSADRLRYVSLRYFNAAGADPEGELGEEHHPETHLIPRVLQVAMGVSEYLEIYGNDYPTKDGTCIRDYVHVSDLATAHLFALDRLAQDGKSEVFNLGTERGYSVREVVDMARSITGRGIPTRDCARRPGDPPVLISSSAKARRELGWEPRLSSLDCILESAWGWHKNHPPRDTTR